MPHLISNDPGFFPSVPSVLSSAACPFSRSTGKIILALQQESRCVRLPKEIDAYHVDDRLCCGFPGASCMLC
jgi:hypothetical protein